MRFNKCYEEVRLIISIWPSLISHLHICLECCHWAQFLVIKNSWEEKNLILVYLTLTVGQGGLMVVPSGLYLQCSKLSPARSADLDGLVSAKRVTVKSLMVSFDVDQPHSNNFLMYRRDG